MLALQPDWLVVFLQSIIAVYHFEMQKIDLLSKYTVLFSYSKLSLVDRNGFVDEGWKIAYKNLGFKKKTKKPQKTKFTKF